MTAILFDYAPLWVPLLAAAIYVTLAARDLRRNHRTPQVWVEPEEKPEITYIEGPVDMGLTHEGQ